MDTRSDLVKELISFIRTQRHDILNHLQVIMGYLQLGRTNLAIDYIKSVSQEITESGEVLQKVSPELAAIFLIKAKQAENTQTAVEFSLNKGSNNTGKGVLELARVMGDIYDFILGQLSSYPIEKRKLSVEVDEEDGSQVIRFIWPQASPEELLDDTQILSHPILEVVRENFNRVEISDIGDSTRLSLYLP